MEPNWNEYIVVVDYEVTKESIPAYNYQLMYDKSFASMLLSHVFVNMFLHALSTCVTLGNILSHNKRLVHYALENIV